ncbi:phage holin family protein [Streptomyces bobili]|uniref:phage holin family protein n=1 Tax=Streptomyces bobili TaxID=67280 RepID=UPI0033AE5ECD
MRDSTARLAQDTADLVRQEVRTIQEEARSAGKRFGAGGVLLAGAGTCGLLALWAAHETLLLAAESVLPRRAASAVLAGAYASGAAALALAARSSMRAAAEAAADALDKETGALESQKGPAAAPAGQEPSRGSD